MSALKAVFLYEWRRSLTAGRIAWWFVMATFPVVITLLLRFVQAEEGDIPIEARDSVWSLLYYITVPCVCTAMGVLLTAGPAVATELEQRSWVYLATRPRGIVWLLLGKYLVATTWGVTAAWTSITVAIPLSNATERMQIWMAMTMLSLLSAISYSAVYLFLGVMLPRRAMVLCVMYTAIVDVLFGFIPAMINRMTVQFRLRSLLVDWVPINAQVRNDSALKYVVGQDSPVLHILWLMVLTALFLAGAIVLAHRKEFTTASEGDI